MRWQLANPRAGLSVKLYDQIYSTVTDCFTHGVFNAPANLRFTLTVKTTSLVGRPYSIYQHKLATQMIHLSEEKGMTFSEIAEWLNKNGYTTPRGKTFTNPHAHSIYTKCYNSWNLLTLKSVTSQSGITKVGFLMQKRRFRGAE